MCGLPFLDREGTAPAAIVKDRVASEGQVCPSASQRPNVSGPKGRSLSGNGQVATMTLGMLWLPRSPSSFSIRCFRPRIIDPPSDRRRGPHRRVSSANVVAHPPLVSLSAWPLSGGGRSEYGAL